ncbi:PREDICTED: uncharacterized protein LOC108776035 [Cyphomyrmex costatus]|uniref:uncharacterized protein LOC108776035 n=1 Tax=Cyphomyrmex costatus TaxID=456900 RepID=UPI000852259D|nr:PREDICTED: uncharacterized protein LOC108776035 [Cyphomyrmex costatus]
MLSEVDVFISNYTLVDPEIYQLWVDGHTSSDAVNILHQRGICQQTNAPIELVASDILDHYRTYALLEKLLHTPTKLASEQLAFQIEPQTSQMLIEMYYEFDDVVIRELLGKKITSKSRKDMDEVAEKTGITLKSCRRQYDNVKRVFKIVEDLPGSLAVNIKQHFLLSEDLAKRYAAVVFIACLRFEMNKRKLQFLTFPDLYHCANSMMSSWTYRCVGSEYFDTDLDREFLQELSECRALLENDKHHKHLVCLKLKPMLLDRSYQELDINFRSYSRAILCIGCNLHRSRELRFFFLELVERCIEPWRQVNWTHSDLRNFLAIYTQCALDMDVLREGELRDAFERYMTVVTCCLLRVSAQENTYRSIASTLRECYENKYLLEKDNRLPHTLNTLIAILRKIENTENGNMDLRALTVGIMHRFRQDGIEKNPIVIEQSGVLPYRSGYQAQKYLQIIRFIPEETSRLLYNIMTDIERCTLHFMLSSSTEIYERKDENTICISTIRNARSVINNFSIITKNVHDDVETLTPEQIDIITNNKDGDTKRVFDPNAMYPEFPPNHPKTARVVDRPPLSRCPVENGVIKTAWGSVSAGPLIAGIAAGLQPENTPFSEFFPNEDDPERMANLSKISIDNKWIATISGDLAEVILMQGPTKKNEEKLSIGADGNWNSSAMPRWYFLKKNKHLQFTTAEIRGDIDGFILANEIEALYTKVPKLRLSQILDLYYSSRGLFNPTIRACNRKTLFQTTISKQIMLEQTYSASLVLEEYLHKATINDDKMKNFATQATEELASYVDLMNNELCHETETRNFDEVVQIAIDLTIIIDTTWPFNEIQSIIAEILDKIDVNQYNSQYTIINGCDGSIMLNTTNSILDFGLYNITNYTNNVTKGFNLPKSLETLGDLQKKKLNDERYGLGNAKSDVVLIIPFTSYITNISDKEYCIVQIKKMREQVPDATLLILTHGAIDKWTDLLPSSNLFSITVPGDIGDSATMAKLILRIKQVPQRLINTQCGANYSVIGESLSFTNCIEPDTIVSYRLHPNYFFSTDSNHKSKIKIQGSEDNLKVCTSQSFRNINETNDSCKPISKDFSIEFSCGDAGLIHLCEPLNLLIIANSSTTNFQYGPDECRFPHMIKYTFSYENLVCKSNANINMLNIFILILSMIYTFL